MRILCHGEQAVEARLTCSTLNLMTELWRPESCAIAHVNLCRARQATLCVDLATIRAASSKSLLVADLESQAAREGPSLGGAFVRHQGLQRNADSTKRLVIGKEDRQIAEAASW